MTQTRLRSLVEYNQDTGVFIRNGNIWGTTVIDHRRGKYKYLRGTIDGKQQLLHRLAWLYVHGVMPDGEIDHLDGNACNNALKNLRVVTRQQNMDNKGAYSNNTSGVKGVSWNRQYNRWRAFINVDGKQVHLGVFLNKEDAISARFKAEEHHQKHKRK